MADQNGELPLDSQTLAALGTARIDHGAATTGLHADQKAMGTGAADFGRLVGAFHLEISGNLCLGTLTTIRETRDYRKFS